MIPQLLRAAPACAMGSLLFAVPISPANACDEDAEVASVSFAGTDLLGSQWEFPQLFETFTIFLDQSKVLRDGGETSPVLQLTTDYLKSGRHSSAMACYAALAENGAAETDLELYALMRRTAGDVLNDRGRIWGAEPLCQAALGYGAHPDELVFGLLDQFDEDAIPHNAMLSGEVLAIGLQRDPDRFLPPLVEKWYGIEGTEAVDSQPGVMVANLLLQFGTGAMASREPGISWMIGAGGYEGYDCESMAGRSSRERKSIVQAAAHWAPRIAYDLDTFGYNLSWGNRRMAWVVLEQHEPLDPELLTEVLVDDWTGGSDRRHALGIWLLRDPQLLASPAWRPVFCDAMARCGSDYWSYTPYVVGQLFGQETEWSSPEGARVELLSDCRTNLASPAAAAQIEAGGKHLILACREALEHERDPRRQIGLWQFLLSSEDPGSRSIVLEAALSNMIDDDEFQNAAEASSAFWRLGEEAIPAARAGVRLGVELGDWQMATRCAGFLLENDGAYAPGDDPELVVFLAEQLRDDDVSNNANAAYPLLLACGAAAAPALSPLRDGSDEQAARLALEILSATGPE